MALGLLHSQRIVTRLGDLNTLSRFPQKRSKSKLSLLVSDCTFTSANCKVELDSSGLKQQRSLGLSSSRKSSATLKVTKLGQKKKKASQHECHRDFDRSFRSHGGSGTVVCEAGGSEFESTQHGGPLLFGYSVSAMWSFASLCKIKPSNLEFGAGNGGSGDGGGNGGNGGNGSGGGGDGGNGSFDAKNSNEILVKDSESREDEEQPEYYRARRFRVFASLSSAAGDAIDGEAPFGDLPVGRKKRIGMVEEAEAFSSGGGVLQKIDKAAHDCLNFLTPGDAAASAAPNAHERSGVQGSFRAGGPSRVKDSELDVLVEEVATRIIHDKDGDDGLAKRSETAALRRLQREAFSDLLKVRERLDKIEVHTGLRQSKTGGPALREADKTRLKGEVCAGGAFVLLEDSSSRYSRTALEQAGLYTGLDVRFTFETSFRGKDVMITECSAGHAGSDGSILGGPISVTKLVYNAQVTDDLTVVVAPLGARTSDITEVVNPLQGDALTQFARVGPALYNHCVGSALGATLRGNSALLSVSQYLSDWGTGSSFPTGQSQSGPLCLSTLAQIMFQPWENSVFSLCAVNRFWPSPPLPSFTGLHWSEMGPLVLSKTSHKRQLSSSSPPLGSPHELHTSLDNNNPSSFSANASWGTPYGELNGPVAAAVPESHGTAMQSVAVAGEIDVGANVSLGGWAQVERGDLLQDSEKRDLQWSVSLGKSLGKTAGWGLCIGSSKSDLFGVGDDSGYLGTRDDAGEECGTQFQVEAFLTLSMGRGFNLQPGLVYLLNKHSQTPAFVLRSSWAL